MGIPPGTFAKAASKGQGLRLDPIAEKEWKRSRVENTKGRDIAHHDDTLTKMQLHIEQAHQEADKILISEVPTNGWGKRYEEAKQEEGAINEEKRREKEKQQQKRRKY